MVEENDRESFSLRAHFAKRVQDFDDLQNEMAGRDVGRIDRFLTADARENRTGGQRREDRKAGLTNLQILMMNNPAYAALYRETAERLNDAQGRLDTALEAVQRARKEVEERLEGQPSAAQRAEDEARLQALAELEADILSGQAEIGDMQLRMQDKDEPVIDDGLKDYQERSAELASGIEDRLHKITASNEASFGPESTKPVVGVVIPEI